MALNKLTTIDEGTVTATATAKSMTDVSWKSLLTWAQIKAANPGAPTHVFIAIKGGHIRVWEKGDTTPTSSDGMPYYDGQGINFMQIGFDYFNLIDNMQFIKVSGTPKLSLEIYKVT